MSARLTESSAAPHPGDVIAGKYQVERTLGRGGMGVVVAARHLLLGDQVALKFLLPNVAADTSLVKRFLREARASSRIKSEHVARVQDVGMLEDGRPFMVMEMLEGVDLGQLVRKRGPLPALEAIDYILQACEAISLAHALGIVHRDLKPSNLFLTRRPDGAPFVKVLDFGIAKIISETDANLTTSTEIMGSPLYMAPEQIRDPRSADHRIDVWSLGVILFKLLSANDPYMGDGVPSVLAMILTDQPQPLHELCADVAPALEGIVLRCLEKDPARRWPSVDALASALRAFVAGRPMEEGAGAVVDASRQRSSEDAGASPKRRGRAFIVAGAGFAVLGALITFAARRGTQTPAQIAPPPAMPTLARAEASLPVVTSTSAQALVAPAPALRAQAKEAPPSATATPTSTTAARGASAAAKGPKPRASVDKDARDAIEDRY